MATYKWLPCRHCNKPVRVEYRAKWASCPECKKTLEAERKSLQNHRNISHCHKDALVVEVIRDPSPPEAGSFPRGAKFTRQEYKLMVKFRYFALGTILRVEKKLIEVRRSGLVEIGGEA